MKRDRITYIKNILFPCVLFSAVTGILTGSLIFLFRQIASLVASRSEDLYGMVRENPAWMPVLLAGISLLGIFSWIFLKKMPDCRGGGIPTSIAQLRGLIPFRWLRSLVSVFFSSLITFFGGIPLGTEGPSVQMGTAVGRGCIRIFGKKHPAWGRYVMTGGACAGFAVATGSPLSGILFAVEEAHRRFTPMLFMVSGMTVVSGSVTARLLCALTGTHWEMFHFTVDTVLPLAQYWAPLTVGLVCGLFAALFTKIYGLLGNLVRKGRIPLFVEVLGVFLLVGGLGFFVPSALGSGHDLIEEIAHGNGEWLFFLLLLLLRVLLLVLANNVGITGGLFVPSLAFGALLGGICGKLLVLAGLLGEEYFVVMVIVGMSAFLGASSRIPLTAIAFALEALCGVWNIIPVVIGVAVSYVISEIFGLDGFSDTVMERRVSSYRKGKTVQTQEKEFVVKEDSFVIGKEVRDILWPPSCLVLSVDRNPAAARSGHLEAGDVLHLHYQTWDPQETEEQIEDLVGKQEE